jgi:uncharacterized protein (TIGR02217 family)
MAFLETPRFSDRLAFGITGGPGFSTEVATVRSGYEQRNANWQQSRGRWDASSAVRTLADFQEIADHFMAVGGRLHGFRLRDLADYQVTQANGFLRGMIGTQQQGTQAGTGYGVASYQLVKRYARGALLHERDIRKPAAGSVTVYRAGTPVTVGVSAGQIALDTTTGLVTFVADASRTITAVAVGVNTTVTVTGGLLPGVSVGGRLWVQGLTGADAALLNGRSHLVNSVGASSYDLTIDTTGRTITAGSGLAVQFPQPTQALTWVGDFDVPVRFDTDLLQRTIVDRIAGGAFLVQAASIPLVEVRT